MRRGAAGESGQATVEFVALLPLVVLVALCLWQAVVVGHTVALAGSASRSAARAQAIGADPGAAARSVLPPRLERGLGVRVRSGGGVALAVRVPSVLGRVRLGTVSAQARFAPQDR